MSHFTRMAWITLALASSLGCASARKQADPEPLTPIDRDLIKAIARGTAEDFHTALKKGASPSKANEMGLTPLMGAAYHEREDLVADLIQRGVDLEAVDVHGQSALHYAALRPTGLTCPVLAKAGALVNRQDQVGLSPLMMAARFGSLGCVEALLAAGADPNLSEPEGWTALFYAIPRTQLNRVQVLVKAGAKLNHTDIEGMSPLHIAAQYNQEEIYNWLITAGAPTQLKDKNGQTAADIRRKEQNRPRKNS